MAKLYQVFVGCPFATEIRSAYDRLKRDVESTSPMSAILADTGGINSTDTLLDNITQLIRESAGCIFDVTGSNPNVSLEVGIAHTIPVDFVLTLKTRKRRKGFDKAPKGVHDFRTIISDLQGKNRIEYRAYQGLMTQVTTRYLNRLPLMKRWQVFCTQNKQMVPYAVKIFADLRSSGRSTRARLASYVEGSGFSSTDVLNALTGEKLVTVRPGRDGGVFYPVK